MATDLRMSYQGLLSARSRLSSAESLTKSIPLLITSNASLLYDLKNKKPGTRRPLRMVGGNFIAAFICWGVIH
jgi:hypothetical protein